jgi:hypothetical protein
MEVSWIRFYSHPRQGPRLAGDSGLFHNSLPIPCIQRCWWDVFSQDAAPFKAGAAALALFLKHP